MVVNDHTQESGDGFGPLGGVQVGAWGKVGHPKVVDEGSFEALGGSTQGLAQLLTPGLGVELMLAQEPVDRVERGQLGVLLQPASVKDFDGHGQVRLGLLENPLLLLGTQGARTAFVGAHLGNQSGKAAELVIIPPIFDRAPSEESLTAIGQGHRGSTHLFQSHRKRKTLAQEVLDFGDEGKTLQGDGLGGGSFGFAVHGGGLNTPRAALKSNPFVGPLPPGGWVGRPRPKTSRLGLRGRSQTGVIPQQRTLAVLGQKPQHVFRRTHRPAQLFPECLGLVKLGGQHLTKGVFKSFDSGQEAVPSSLQAARLDRFRRRIEPTAHLRLTVEVTLQSLDFQRAISQTSGGQNRDRMAARQT